MSVLQQTLIKADETSTAVIEIKERMRRVEHHLNHYPSLSWLALNRPKPMLIGLVIFVSLVALVANVGTQQLVRLLAAITGIPIP